MQVSEIINKIKNNKTIVIIIAAVLFILLAVGLASCSKSDPGDSEPVGSDPSDADIIADDDYEESEDDKVYDMTLDALDTEKLESTILEETEDAGQEYLDNTLLLC